MVIMWRSGVCHLLSMCLVQIKVKIKFVILLFESPTCNAVSSPGNLYYLYYTSPKHQWHITNQHGVIPQDYIIYINPKSHIKFLVPQQMCYALRHWFSNFRVERTVRGVCYCFMNTQWVGLKEEEAVPWQSRECFSLVSLWFHLLGGIFKCRGNFHICDTVDDAFTVIVTVRFNCSWHLKVLAVCWYNVYYDIYIFLGVLLIESMAAHVIEAAFWVL